MGVENCYLLIYYKSDNDSFFEGNEVWKEEKQKRVDISILVMLRTTTS